jgi:lysophospholipase L1-like esterase
MSHRSRRAIQALLLALAGGCLVYVAVRMAGPVPGVTLERAVLVACSLALGAAAWGVREGGPLAPWGDALWGRAASLRSTGGLGVLQAFIVLSAFVLALGAARDWWLDRGGASGRQTYPGLLVAASLLALAAGLAPNGWVQAAWRWYRERSSSSAGFRRAAMAGWITLWVAAALVGVGYVVLADFQDPPFAFKASTQPYLVHGDIELSGEKDIRQREGPEAYGYVREGETWVFPFERSVGGMADRGDFLFQDRAGIANEPPGSRLRVFAVGGSVVFGYGASNNDKRWYVWLERSLTEGMGQPVSIIPTGLGGYVSTQERLALDLMVLPRCPDAVIILDGFNDIGSPAVYGARPGDPFDQGVLYEEFLSGSYALKKWLARQNGRVALMLHDAFQKSMTANQARLLSNPAARQRYVESTSAVYTDNVLRMLDQCRGKQVACAAFLQPAQFVTDRRRGGEPGHAIISLFIDTYTSAIQAMQAHPHRPPFHDLTGIFDADSVEPWYADPVHPSDIGHRRLAEAMYPTVLALLKGRSAAQMNPANCQPYPARPSG